MREPPHADDRRRVGQTVGRDDEDVPVAGRAVDVGRLLAGEPARRVGPACAVADRAAETGVVLDQRARVGIEHERGGAAAGQRVVGGGRRGERRAVAALVVTDHADEVAVAEGGHAVVGAGRRRAVGHDIVAPAEAHVLEAPRQVEQLEPGRLVPHGSERPVTEPRRLARRGAGRTGAEGAERAGERDTRAGADRGLQERPAIQRGPGFGHDASLGGGRWPGI